MDSVHATEEWRPVPGWPYEVSSHGRVRRTEPGRGTVAGRLLKRNVNRKGYAYVNLCRDRGAGHETWRRGVYVLVCEAFHGPKPLPPPGAARMQVRHLNGDTGDDRASNLCWGTPREDIEDRRRHGTLSAGERHYRTHLSAEDVARIRAEYAGLRGSSGRVPNGWRARVAERHGVVIGTIAAIVGGQSW
jgi:hypothetical protein